MEFQFNDGGRKDAGYKGGAGDCVVRSIAIATELPYQEVYDLINEFGKRERVTRTKSRKSTARNGVYKATIRRIMDHLGWTWTPTMFVGQGCKVHLKASELPAGRILVSLSKHTSAVIDGVMHDTYPCDRQETRCVYGYWSKQR